MILKSHNGDKTLDVLNKRDSKATCQPLTGHNP